MIGVTGWPNDVRKADIFIVADTCWNDTMISSIKITDVTINYAITTGSVVNNIDY